jgi:hypothetical protein
MTVYIMYAVVILGTSIAVAIAATKDTRLARVAAQTESARLRLSQ